MDPERFRKYLKFENDVGWVRFPFLALPTLSLYTRYPTDISHLYHNSASIR